MTSMGFALNLHGGPQPGVERPHLPTVAQKRIRDAQASADASDREEKVSKVARDALPGRCGHVCLGVARDKYRFSAGALVWTNAFMFVFHVGFFVTTVLVGNRDLTVPVYKTDLNFTERTPNSSDPSDPAWELIPKYVHLVDVHFTWLVASFFALSAFAHFGNAFLWRTYYLDGIADCRTPTRFVEYFFSASVMILVLSYQVGVRDYSLLLAIAGLISTTMGHGYLVELVARPADDTKWTRPLSDRLTPYWLGWIPQLLAWGIVVASFYDQDYSMAPNGPPQFVYIILWGEVALFSSFGFVMLWQQCNPPARYVIGEYGYQLLSLVSKGFLGAIMLSMVLVLGSFEESLD